LNPTVFAYDFDFAKIFMLKVSANPFKKDRSGATGAIDTGSEGTAGVI
jgi:hypothetical protein